MPRGRGRYNQHTVSTLRAARDLLAESRVRPPGAAANSRLTLARFAEQWIETTTGRSKRGLRESTRAAYRASLDRYIVPELGHIRLVNLGVADCKGRPLAANETFKAA